MTLDGQPVDITGTLSWLPKKTGLDKSLLLLVGDFVLLGAVVAGLALYARRRRRRPADDPTPPAPDALDCSDAFDLSLQAGPHRGNGHPANQPSRPPRAGV
jgi:hypothetical protein